MGKCGSRTSLTRKLTTPEKQDSPNARRTPDSAGNESQIGGTQPFPFCSLFSQPHKKTETMAPQQQQQQQQRARQQHLPSPPASFTIRKLKILEQLSVPDAEYTDASPKGSVDVGILELIGELNALDGFVTTSSCAGRVSVFLEGRRAAPTSAPAGTAGVDDSHLRSATQSDDNVNGSTNTLTTIAGPGGKGGGGTWLFVSHDPVPEQHDGDDELLRLLGLVGEKGPAPPSVAGDSGSSQPGRRRKRLIHFKFEPMVRSPRHLMCTPSHGTLCRP